MRDAETITKRADEQHQQVLRGDPRGTYGARRRRWRTTSKLFTH